MIPKNAYVLILTDYLGRSEVVYPKKKTTEKHDRIYVSSLLRDQFAEYILDYSEVLEYIRENYGMKSPQTVCVCRVCELLEVKVTSAYPEKE